jgi:threonine/homoserine/homoserine lactone efflux protein
LGNALAIALYSAIAGFGVTAASAFLLHLQGWLHLIGGLFLVSLGCKIMRTKPIEQATSVISESLSKELLSTFLLAIVNPVTILLFAAAFTSMNLEHTGNVLLSVTLVVLGVLLGSFFWQCVSTAGISLLGNTFLRRTRWMIWINSLSGGILFVLGGIILLNLLKSPLSSFSLG